MLNNFLVGISQEFERQSLLCAEILVAIRRIDTDADYHGILLSQAQAGLSLVHDPEKCSAYVEAAVFRIGDVFRRMLDGWAALD